MLAAISAMALQEKRIDDSFFSQPSLTSFQFEVGDLLFNSHTGPECPDMIRLVKYLD